MDTFSLNRYSSFMSLFTVLWKPYHGCLVHFRFVFFSYFLILLYPLCPSPCFRDYACHQKMIWTGLRLYHLFAIQEVNLLKKISTMFTKSPFLMKHLFFLLIRCFHYILWSGTFIFTAFFVITTTIIQTQVICHSIIFVHAPTMHEFSWGTENFGLLRLFFFSACGKLHKKALYFFVIETLGDLPSVDNFYYEGKGLQ